MKPTNSSSPAKTAKKRGPKPKPAEEQLSQLTIRLTPKLKYGLELLARAQHRSLSQAVEWSLQNGLNSFEVGAQRHQLGALVDQAWGDGSDVATRLLHVYRNAPELLDIDQRAACVLAEASGEAWAMHEATNTHHHPSALSDYRTFVRKAWPAIEAAAKVAASNAREAGGLRLLDALGFAIPSSPQVEVSLVNLFRLLSLRTPEPFDPLAWQELVDELNESAKTVSSIGSLERNGIPAPYRGRDRHTAKKSK